MTNRIPTGREIYVEINGERIAVAQNYKLKGSRPMYKVEELGNSRPVKILQGDETYTVELSRVYITDSEIDFYSLSDFSLIIVKPDRKIVFSGCEWAEIEEEQNLSAPCVEKIKLVSNRRDVI